VRAARSSEPRGGLAETPRGRRCVKAMHLAGCLGSGPRAARRGELPGSRSRAELRRNFAAPGAANFHGVEPGGAALELCRARCGQLPWRWGERHRVWDFAATRRGQRSWRQPVPRHPMRSPIPPTAAPPATEPDPRTAPIAAPRSGGVGRWRCRYGRTARSPASPAPPRPRARAPRTDARTT